MPPFVDELITKLSLYYGVIFLILAAGIYFLGKLALSALSHWFIRIGNSALEAQKNSWQQEIEKSKSEYAKKLAAYKCDLDTQANKSLEEYKSSLSLKTDKQLAEYKNQLEQSFSKDIEQYKSNLAQQNNKELEVLHADMTKTIEKLKFRNEQLNYVTKTQFDTEFKIYQDLTQSCYQAVFAESFLFPDYDRLPEDETEKRKIFIQRDNDVRRALLEFQNNLYKSAPFITEEFYQQFNELFMLINVQHNYYRDLVLHEIEALARSFVRDGENEKCQNRHKEILDKHKKQISDLRHYLKSLRVE